MITIEVASYNDIPLATPNRAEFGDEGGTIGRSSENTLVLVDPDRKISRTHATIRLESGGFVLRDQGSVVPVSINDQPLGNGREAPLRGGDVIRIGGYVLSVKAIATTGANAPQPAQAAPAPEAPAAGDMAPVLSWDKPEAAPVDHVTTVILSASAHETPAVASPAEAEAEAAPPRGMAGESPAQPAVQPAAAHAAGPAHQAAPPATPATTAASPGAVPATTDQLMRALLAGAGLPAMEIPGGLTPKLMFQLGQILREATGGMLDLLAARANTKRQVRADMTVIVASDNNPLKFSPGMEAALSHMLVPRGKGFMPPLRAVDDAYEDLRAHQVGFMAGMRSALTVVLGRFDP
jgi:FHA domain-containing protein